MILLSTSDFLQHFFALTKINRAINIVFTKEAYYLFERMTMLRYILWIQYEANIGGINVYGMLYIACLIMTKCRLLAS